MGAPAAAPEAASSEVKPLVHSSKTAAPASVSASIITVCLRAIIDVGILPLSIPYILYAYLLNFKDLKMFGGKSFDPAKDIPDLSGKVIFITGNAGLGKETVLQLASHKPSHIYLGARSASKAEEAIADIKAHVPDALVSHISLDLTSFASIKECARAFAEKSSRLDVLINNAGIMATPMALTKEGYEIQFGTNHMGHFFLTKLLLPIMLKTAEEPDSDVRIVNVASQAHNFAPSGVFLSSASEIGKYWTWRRYGYSKLCNILFTKELARRYPTIKAVALHPGLIITDLWVHMKSTVISRVGLWLLTYPGAMFVVNAQQGAHNQLWAATAPKERLQSGTYYLPVGKKCTFSLVSWSDDLSKKLWEFSDKETDSYTTSK